LPTTNSLKDAQSPRRSAGVTFAAGLSFENITHSYGDKPILIDLSLTVEPGEVLCLLGPSGSGKTTLLRIAAGIEAQSAGRVLLNGREIAGPSAFLPPERRGVGLMFQDFALFPHMTIVDNVRYGLTALPKDQARAEALYALERVGLADYAEDYPHRLSGGQQQRVALARALAPRPAVLLMDEPFSGLDSRLKDAIRADTLSILREARVTAIVVTHDAEEAMRMADRIALLKDGRLVQVGPSETLYRNPANLFAASFFSEVNLFEGVVLRGQVETPLGAIAAPGIADHKTVDVALRLSGLKIAADGEGAKARILSRRFLGVVDMFTLAVEGLDEPIRARIRADEVPQGLRDVVVSMSERDTLVFEKAIKTD
jgi:iron(III) transport system ATP-binding protein